MKGTEHAVDERLVELARYYRESLDGRRAMAEIIKRRASENYDDARVVRLERHQLHCGCYNLEHVGYALVDGGNLGHVRMIDGLDGEIETHGKHALNWFERRVNQVESMIGIGQKYKPLRRRENPGVCLVQCDPMEILIREKNYSLIKICEEAAKIADENLRVGVV